MIIVAHLIAITIAFFLDKMIGDPPNLPHPVRWIGSTIAKLENKWNRGSHRRRNGLIMLITVLAITSCLTILLIWLSYSLHYVVGILVESLIISTTIAQKSLMQAANEVYIPLNSGDREEARLKLSYIVGRDTEELQDQEIVRATVETVVENISDGVTAPLFWALIGGAPLAMMYRAINTCDSMVGYRNERYEQFGWASAKLDDLVNWIPSRLTAWLMIIVIPRSVMPKKQAWEVTRRDARNHPSPNSGWLEASFAALYGVQLGGMNTYKGVISNRAKMGEAIYPLSDKHIQEAIRVLHFASFYFMITLWVVGGMMHVAFTWF